MPGLLTFEPVFKSMLWGGSRLPGWLGVPLAGGDPVGEAWVLSDVQGSESRVARGPHRGKTLRELIAEFPHELLGDATPADGKFPLLLKFIDAKQPLSVQVHPDDAQAARLKGPGHRGKTEAWVVLDANPATSLLYAGFRPGVTAADFRRALADGTAADALHAFTPAPGDTLFLRAGTVHAIGAGLLIFEVQQTSDITFRLHDWDRVDAKTGRPRELHLDDGLACADFAAGPCDPVTPTPTADGRDELVACEHFTLHRRAVTAPVTFENAAGRVLVAVAGRGTVNGEPLATGGVVLVPASVRSVTVAPTAGPLTLLECGLGRP
jgi:mannose-6-phosphate isomerase